jgi:parallel beta-helix repeat protein
VILNNCAPTAGCKGIYLDDEQSNVTITGNILQGGWAQIQIHGGDHNTVQNNIFDLSPVSGSYPQMMFYQQDTTPDYGMGGNVFTQNIVYTSGSANGIVLWNNQKTGNDANPAVSNNVYYAAGGGTWANPSGGVTDTKPTTTVNPQFASASAGNYTMQSPSPAYAAVGFQPLPTNQGPVANAASTAGGGVLTGSVSSAANSVNLTLEGTTDWVHWSNGSLIRKSGVTPQLDNFSVLGSGTAGSYSNDPRTVTWSDGSPASTGTDQGGVEIGPASTGFSVTAPAGPTSHTVVVHVGGWASSGTLTAHLSDGSAPDFVDTTPQASGQFDRNYTLTYSAASAGATLTIEWQQNGGTTGNVTLGAVALQ